MHLTKIYKKITGRKNVPRTLEETFRNKDILVTGGCGSIGSEVVKQLLRYYPKRIKVFDNNESGLFYLQERFKSLFLRILVGDIRDKERLKMAVKGTDIIFHAAALKHVPLCEYNPFEAVSTNVIGTQNLVEVAREAQVKKVIAISTDKAVNPINTMGATKLLAEKIILTGEIGDKCITKFSCVRFGNVLNSVASVVPIFKQQIKSGGPITLTSPEMVRFFMSMPEAVNLVLRAAHLSQGNEIFILKMKRIKITDLVEVLIQKLAPKYGYNPSDIKIKIIGVRPGEKLDEHLITEEEKQYLININQNLAVLRLPIILAYHPSASRKIKQVYVDSSKIDINEGILLTKEEINYLMDNLNLLD